MRGPNETHFSTNLLPPQQKAPRRLLKFDRLHIVKLENKCEVFFYVLVESGRILHAQFHDRLSKIN